MRKVLALILAILMVGMLTFQGSSVLAAGFKDVPETHWAYKYIMYLANNKILAGYPDGTFKPEQSVSREEFAKVVVTAKKLSLYTPATPTFKDVPKTRWSYGYVEAAVKAGYIKGISPGVFSPTAGIRRQDMALLLTRVLGREAEANAIKEPITFSNDEGKIYSYAYGAMTLAVRYDGQFLTWDRNRNLRPLDSSTRAEVAHSIYMVLKPPVKGGIVNFGLTQNPDTLFSLLGSMAASRAIVTGVESVLIGQTPEGTLYPSLAKEIPTVENGMWKVNEAAKTMIVTYKLRKGANWSDGKPVTAKDAVFTFNMIMNDKVNVVTRYVEEKIEKMETPDPYTLVVYWKDLYPLANWGVSMYPEHILGPIYNKNPEDINTCDYNQKPIHFGPYVLDVWASENYVRLKANPNYWAGKPLIDTYIFWIYADVNTMLANFLAGKLDAMMPGMGLDTSQAMVLRDKASDKFNVKFVPSIFWEHISIQLDKSLAGKDKKVRQALQIAIDRNEINRKIFFNTRFVCNNWIPIGSPFENINLDPYTFDPAKANAMLDEAGYKRGADGIRVTPDGQRFKIILFSTTKADRASQATMIKKYWADVGVEMEFKPLTASKLFGDVTPKGEYDMALFAWGGNPADPGAFTLYHSGQVPTEENGWEGQNYTHIRNAELDKQMDITVSTVDPAKRKAAFLKAQEIIHDELPELYLSWFASPRGERKGLTGVNYEQDSGNISFTWNIEYWYWEK